MREQLEKGWPRVGKYVSDFVEFHMIFRSPEKKNAARLKTIDMLDVFKQATLAQKQQILNLVKKFSSEIKGQPVHQANRLYQGVKKLVELSRDPSLKNEIVLCIDAAKHLLLQPEIESQIEESETNSVESTFPTPRC
jgi:hypothetical protein